ncbi:GNAT family N-acetyltransferase [Niallia sp. 03133]|uniref:GNAT family N-acetyltransferase n=1 Tax=Niallia sp. 03133 TaxID=3458060 RepID=UPI004043FA7E
MRNTVLKGKNVILRSIHTNDLPLLWQLIYGEEKPEWKEWDAPYFPLKRIEYEAYKNQMIYQFQQNDIESRLIVEVDKKIIGTVSCYWEHKPSNWLEIGIVIYDSAYWSGGYGTESLNIWMAYLFTNLSLVRIGLTTWSGNRRMMRVAEKLGMQLEGRLRKCRLHNGIYYDSIRMGILREEWEGY